MECNKDEVVRKIGAPMKDQESSLSWSSFQQQQGTNYLAANGSSTSGVKFPTASNSIQAGYSARQSAHPSQPASGNLKRAHAKASMSGLNQEAFLEKGNFSMKTDVEGGFSSQENIHGNENAVLREERVVVVGDNKPRSLRELSNLEIQNMLAEKARMEITQKLKEWSTTTASPEVIKHDLRKDITAHDSLVDSKKLCKQKKWLVFSASIDLEQSMTVPDSDFHNFDKDRTEKPFDDNQVWATYDEDYVISRYYDLIHKVMSKKPFKVQFSWLNSKSNSELVLINWVRSGFPKTSGDFRIGKYEINKTLNSFSHKVKWVKEAKGVIQIFPRKGDVWALYRHWSPNWNEPTPDDMIHNYDMMEVLCDYTEKAGVTVAPLIKVVGFMLVFHQHSDPKYFCHIPREEMFRFSHQVPSYLLTSEEAPNAPTGCWELYPAALPLELLKFMTDAEIEALRNVADTSNLERTCGERKEEEKSYVVGDNNVTKGEEIDRDSKSVSNNP
ncbi:hypothetical protein HAX54_000724 [Datura stramonium]|uniref:DUF3444 domain-containing protein n=1 Tax=Datura stramonium TaxID=4076 RepID=A0ABS8T2A0_DATST|nr:hypothetical protein [Datura stramonium]